MSTYSEKSVEEAHELKMEVVEDNSSYPDSNSGAIHAILDNQLKLAAKLDAILDVMVGSV